MELFDRANQLHLDGKFQEAEELYDQLLTQNHDNAGLLATFGTLYIKMGKYGLAISLLERAHQTLNQSDILCNLAIAYKYSGQHKKALENFKKASEEFPTAETIANYSALYVNVGEPETGAKLANQALNLDPSCAMAHWNLSMCHLEMGHWKAGWEEYEWGFANRMRVRRVIDSKPYWDGTPGKVVAVYGEQGLGDELMFASMLPDLMKQNTVILECHDRLKTLFERSFPGLTCYGTRKDVMITWPSNHQIDYSVSIGSLGKWFRNSKTDFPGNPYLEAEAAPRGDKFRVGISWTGGQKEGRVRTRSIPLAWWGSILRNDCEFISLQYTDCAEDIASAEKVLGVPIKQFDEIKANDYYETAKLVKSCDLVISCCTTVIHLAGALGVPCWVMVPNKPAWRYGVKGPMPWYRSVRLYRQPLGDKDSWMPVVHRVGLDLEDLVSSRSNLEHQKVRRIYAEKAQEG